MVLAISAFAWQDKTGPTYPLEGTVETSAGTAHYIFVRSETINTPLPIVLLDPVPPGVIARVEYRRFKSHDAWTVLPLERGEFAFSRRGRASSLSGLGVALPGLPERAGKYEIFVKIADARGRFVSVTGPRPVYARFKGAVPTWLLAVHILVIFSSMMFAIRTVLEAAIDGNYHWMTIATIHSFILGAFVFGPMLQWYAFGVWWAGIPFGYDWTDNKVLLSLGAWCVAAWMNRRGRRSRAAVYAAGFVTLLVYFIPHSVFGSEFDYRTGTGHGTAG